MRNDHGKSYSFEFVNFVVPSLILDFPLGEETKQENSNSLDESTEQEVEFNLNHHPIKIEGIEDHFLIEFKISLKVIQTGFSITMTAHGIFKALQPIDENFVNLPFVNINAPAIIYPYIRAFISTVTLNAGVPQLTIPIFNFVQGKTTRELTKSKNNDKKIDR